MRQNETTAPLRIEKVVRVVDTRTFEEIGDRWVPMPGTGRENECGRCGRLHEIHAIVRLSDGSESIVGVSCMKAESLELAERARKLAAGATKLARLQAELARALELAELAERTVDQARAAFVPTFSIEVRERREGLERQVYGATFQVLSCAGLSSRWLVHSTDTAELRAELERDALLRAGDVALEASKLRTPRYYRDAAARARNGIQRIADAQANTNGGGR